MNLEEMLSGARDTMTVKRVYGDPIERDGMLVVPAANVMGGGGGGGGGEAETPGGVGFGMRATPAGAWIIRDGDVSWEPAVDATRLGTMGMLVAIVFLWTIRSISKARAKARSAAG